LKLVKGSGWLASILTLLHGFYLLFYLLSVLVFLIGLSSLAPPVLDPIGLAILDMIVYLFLGVGMLLARRTYFIYAVLWTIWGALLATFAATYKDTVLNLLGFLIVFSCTYYHVSVSRTNAEVAKALGQLAGVLALLQGIIVACAFTLAYILRVAVWIILLPSVGLYDLAHVFAAVIMTAVVYLVLGVGMLKGKKEFFFLAIFWALTEAVLTIADSSYMYTHFNVISMLIVAFASYYYFRTTKP